MSTAKTETVRRCGCFASKHETWTAIHRALEAPAAADPMTSSPENNATTACGAAQSDASRILSERRQSTVSMRNGTSVREHADEGWGNVADVFRTNCEVGIHMMSRATSEEELLKEELSLLQAKIASLEQLVAELLLKNQQLRSALGDRKA